MDVREYLIQATQYTKDNLRSLCEEVIKLKAGENQGPHLQNLTHTCAKLTPSNALALAENIVSYEAMQYVLRPMED